MKAASHFQLVSQALHWTAENQFDQPDLGELARAMGVSPHHLQRVFQEWAGVSPKQFLKSLTRQAALARLAQGDTVLDAAISSGLSGPSRLHDLLISTDALTPGEARLAGRGVDISYGFGDTPFGEALVSWNERGINFLGFRGSRTQRSILAECRGQLKNARFSSDPRGANAWLERIFSDRAQAPLPLWLRGSPFQLKVWEALLAIPEGAHSSYGTIARYVGSPGAAQAVGGAVGNNPVAWVIPCHRVIRKLGELGGYHWGRSVKSAMIGFEATGLSR